MNHYPAFWILICVVALATFSLRAFFIFSNRFDAENPLMQKVLEQVPTAIMAALVVGSMHLSPETMAEVDLKRLTSLVIAGVVAWRTRNLLLTILSGFIALGGLTLAAGF